MKNPNCQILFKRELNVRGVHLAQETEPKLNFHRS